jgi:pimeloyl-ACP methyl ester carboxylesterase
MPTEQAIAGAVLVDHRIRVPLDHDRAAGAGEGGGDDDGETIEVYAREVAAPDGRDRPFLVFLQGGPGHEAPRPAGGAAMPSWLARALQDYRVLLLDQRGTGRSTPYGPPGPDPATDAERLTHFRADAIVRDAELLREHLGVRTWSVLGQSFGGYCSLHYLCVAPDSLREVFVTGGLPPVGRPVDDVYAATFQTMRRLNDRYHRQFPGDRERLARLLDRCTAGEVPGPGGEPMSPRLLGTIGHHLGMGGGAELVHFLLERDPDSAAFRHDLVALLPFDDRNPLYAVLHESSYTDGGHTGWSAQRVQPDDFGAGSDLLTAEHLYPWHFEDDARLRPYQAVASRLADHPWPRLFDAERLAAVDIPCAAVIYADDPYVDRRFSEETAALVPSMRPWLTNAYLHNGLRLDGARILDRLIGLAHGTV